MCRHHRTSHRHRSCRPVNRHRHTMSRTMCNHHGCHHRTSRSHRRTSRLLPILLPSSPVIQAVGLVREISRASPGAS